MIEVEGARERREALAALRANGDDADSTGRREEDAASDRLVARCKAGDKQAFALLYERYFDRVYSYVWLVISDRHEAEDVTQDAFICAIKALPRYEIRRGEPFRAWLFRIARNAAIDRLRSSKRLTAEDPAKLDLTREAQEVVHADPNGEVRSLLRWISDAELERFVERLPESQRTALVLRYFFDMATEEIAAVMKTTPKAVYALQTRTLETLKDRLEAIGWESRRRRRRAPMLIRLKPAPVMAARRFALGGSSWSCPGGARSAAPTYARPGRFF